MTNYYIYDGEKAILNYNSGGAIVARNLYGRGIDEILMRTDNVLHQTYYFQQDHEGSVTHLTDGTGTVTEKYKYDAFGAPTMYNAGGAVITSSAYGNRALFTGREYDSTFGIYEYRARAYHPGLGRFMSEDPKGFDARDYNLFRYVHNDPEDLTDPMGLLGLPLIDPPDPPEHPVFHTGSLIPTRERSVTVTGQNVPWQRTASGGPPRVDFRNAPLGTPGPNAPSRLIQVGGDSNHAEIQPATKDGTLLKGAVASRETLTIDKKATTINPNVIEKRTSEGVYQYYPNGKIRDELKAASRADITGHIRAVQSYEIWFRAQGQDTGYRYLPSTTYEHTHNLLHGVEVGLPGFRQLTE